MEIVSGPIGRQKTHYRAPPSKMVAKEIERFLTWFNAPLKNTKVSRVRRNKVADHPNGLVRAAIAHLWFETIHPFEDGNGRVGRAIVDLALAQDLKSSSRIFSVSRQLMQERDAYYQALERAQRGTVDVTEWVIWFLQQFNHACLKSQAVISEALAKSQYWAAHRGHRMNARQHKVILKLLDAGREGFEGGLGADKYCNLTGASKPTATRDLADLLKDGWVTVTGAGRSTRYWANIDWHGADRANA